MCWYKWQTASNKAAFQVNQLFPSLQRLHDNIGFLTLP